MNALQDVILTRGMDRVARIAVTFVDGDAPRVIRYQGLLYVGCGKADERTGYEYYYHQATFFDADGGKEC